jgi:hypothetical protein
MEKEATTADIEKESWPVRRFLLWIVLAGIVGLGIELVLLEHFEETLQWIPLVLLVLGFGAAVALALRASRAAVRALQLVSALYIAAGTVGLWLHFDGNMEFEREDDPSAATAVLVRRAIFGATPLLAPGALVQLGLIGLCIGYRHPALGRRPPTSRELPGTSTPSLETR